MKTQFALFIALLLCIFKLHGQENQETFQSAELERLLIRVFDQAAFDGVPGWVELNLNDQEAPKMKIYYEHEKHKQLKNRLAHTEAERDSLMTLLLDVQAQVSSLQFRQDQLLIGLQQKEAERDSLQGVAYMARTDHQDLLKRHEALTEQFIALLEECNTKEQEPGKSFVLESSLDDVPCEEVEGWLEANVTYDLQFNPTEKLGYGVQLAAFKDLCKAYEEAQNYIEQESRQDLYIKAKMRNGGNVLCRNMRQCKDIATAEWVASQFASKPDVFIIPH